jgi:hypothetical protein
VTEVYLKEVPNMKTALINAPKKKRKSIRGRYSGPAARRLAGETKSPKPKRQKVRIKLRRLKTRGIGPSGLGTTSAAGARSIYRTTAVYAGGIPGLGKRS